MESIVYWVLLHNALNYRGNNVKALLGYFKDARSIYCADDEEIDKCSDITPSEKERLCSRSLSDAQKIVRRCKGINCRILPICDEKYPDKLRKIDDPPAVIFVKGDISHIDEPCAAIVGTRNPSLSGKTMAYNCAAELSKNGIHIISGCADGIDTQAHKGALQTGFDTYAVLGGGVNHKYLKKNQLLRTEISKHGALISEYPPDIEPTEYTFPLRNRIISALSDCTIVVEASKISGTMITAEYSIIQKKPIFVLCGDYKRALSDVADTLIEYGAWVSDKNNGYADIIKWIKEDDSERKHQDIDIDSIKIFRRNAKQDKKQAELNNVLSFKETVVYKKNLRDMYILGLIDKVFSSDTDPKDIEIDNNNEYKESKPYVGKEKKINKRNKIVISETADEPLFSASEHNDKKDDINMLNITEKTVKNDKKQAKNNDFSADMLTENARAVYDTISDTPIFTDQIISAAGMSISDVMSSLTELELYGFIVPLPNGKYVRK